MINKIFDISEEFFLFLRGANLHIYNQDKNYISRIMKSDYKSILSKYILPEPFVKTLEDVEIN